MKSFRGFALGLVLGLAAALSTVGIAQNAKQTDQNQKTESCCAMESCCCCKGDSCRMNHEAMGQAQKPDAKSHSAKAGCCCCGGDSCDMHMKDMKDEPKAN